jgi:uncharacterized protein (DUF486 family)
LGTFSNSVSRRVAEYQVARHPQGTAVAFLIRCTFPFNRLVTMSFIWLSIFLLSLSNVFMTFAWYAHLKELNERPWFIAAFISWGIAFFEYILQVPANRIGHQVLSVAQLKILQEVITLTVFVPFAVFYLKERMKWDYVWAAFCILGAVYFIFRGNFSK